ncbi:MAG: hypothetical protein ACMG6S_09545 [Byssovorax sp.]
MKTPALQFVAPTPRAVRAFQIVYTILVLNFFIPAISYMVRPDLALANVDQINRLLGGGPYPIDESGQLWRMLAVGNVMTLAFLCALLLIDLRRFWPALPALAFLKSYSALYSLWIGAAHHLPVFYAVFAFDGLTTLAMVFFATRAHRAIAGGEPVPLFAWLVLWSPGRVQASLARVRDAAIVEAVPNLWQIFLGVLRMAHRLVFRTDTVGTSLAHAVRSTRRARWLQYRAIRLPFLMIERAVAPLDFSGLASTPDRIMRHLLGAHHDGAQFVYDLQLLALHPGKLEELRDAVRAVLAADDARARWLRDLTVFEGYHEALLAATEQAISAGAFDSPDGGLDPDLSLLGYLRWCARQPASAGATLRAWRRGELRFAAA